jgi:tRNA-dihydrouridine synthase B
MQYTKEYTGTGAGPATDGNAAPPALRIRDVHVYPPLVLAPMAGVTDEPFRRLTARFGAGLTVTEMVSAEGLHRRQSKTLELCRFDPLPGCPTAVQIFGSDPEVMAEAARCIQDLGAQIVDINAGCPVRKVVRQGAGAALLKDPDRLARIVERVRSVVQVPVTVKTRLGWDARSVNVASVLRGLESAGADAVTVHARTAVQHYSGRADREQLRLARKAALSIPVIGNGDVTAPLHADEMLKETGCDAVMIGRAALGNPWLFAAVAARWTSGAGPGPVLPDAQSFLDTVLDHATAFLAHRPPASARFRKLLMWYAKGCPGASGLRGALMGESRPDKMLELFREWVKGLEERGADLGACKVGGVENRVGAAAVHDPNHPIEKEEGEEAKALR